MRNNLARFITALVFILIGMTFFIIAIFAFQFHLDNNQAFGPNRIALATLGIIFIITGVIIYVSQYFKRVWESPVVQRAKPFFNWIKTPYLWLIKSNQEKPEPVPALRGTALFAIAGAGLAIFISLWYITSGRMLTWTPSTTYFDRQANAFLAGQLSLLEKPPAALVALTNPYQYKNRIKAGLQTNDYIWDASLYNGKYYYYWGPVPALLAALVKIFQPAWVIQDQYLILFAIVGLAIFLAALFYWLKKNCFPRIPGWLVMLMTLLGVLNTSVFWLVNHPDVHEVPIAIGELFLVLGLYTALTGFQSKQHQVLLMALTGLFWGAAIGSRIDLSPGLAWMVLLVFLFLLFKSKKWPLSIGGVVALVLPLLFWAGGLAWYNYARFGNILETGHRFQLTGGALPADYRNIVSVSYILPNLYNLLARPLEIYWHEFPFLYTPFIRSTMWPKIFFYPRDLNYFYNEPITGLFVSMPIIWLVLIIGFIGFIRTSRVLRKGELDLAKLIQAQPISTWIAAMVSGAFIFNLGTLSIFIFSTMRYQADLTPLLTILFALCVGWASSSLHSYPRLWRLVLFLIGILILISVIIGLLTNFQNGDWIFKNNNPQLYQSIVHFFTGK